MLTETHHRREHSSATPGFFFVSQTSGISGCPSPLTLTCSHSVNQWQCNCSSRSSERRAPPPPPPPPNVGSTLDAATVFTARLNQNANLVKQKKKSFKCAKRSANMKREDWTHSECVLLSSTQELQELWSSSWRAKEHIDTSVTAVNIYLESCTLLHTP